MAPKTLAKATITGNPQTYEDQNVHAIYDQIAPHFSSTRYKPWPIIADFLANLPTGWVGLDSGTGNGKYIPLPAERPGAIWTIGLDRSRNLLEIAKTAGGVQREVILGNVLDSPWRLGVFDYAISIATIHHLASTERRKFAIRRLLQSVSASHGRVLIYVWAIEQDDLSKRKVTSEDEEVSANGKDVMVPWVLSKELSKQKQDALQEPQVFNRYYHMFAKGELASLAKDAAVELGLEVGSQTSATGGHGVEIVQDGWERSNYYVELRMWQK